MTGNIRRLGIYLLSSFFAVSLVLAYWQVVEADRLSASEDNPAVIALRANAARGNIFDATGTLLAWTERGDGFSRRLYADPNFSHPVGYASLTFGTSGLEQAFDTLLTGQSDPNPVRQVVDEILEREPQPKDLRLTLDRRLQGFAAGLIGDRAGSVVAIDPRSGALLAMVSRPTFDATPIGAGDQATARATMEQLQARPDAPLVDRARDGRYVPGSVMKVVTAAAALEAGVITPETTFPDQPRQEVEGFPVEGFLIREHDLGGIRPDLWPLSPALQVSSNIYFAHVGLELGPERYLDYARRFGFCGPLAIGPPNHQLRVAPSLVTPSEGGEPCRPFADQVELASTAFGQAFVEATPMQFALVAAIIANGGIMPRPYLVTEVLRHSEAREPTGEVLERLGGDGGRAVISGTAAAQVRSAMVDAVEDELGTFFAGAGAVDRYGVSGVETAGKTGTAQRGEGQQAHSWFIGFAPAGEGAQPAIAVAVILEGAGAGASQAAPVGGRVMAEWLRLSASAPDE